MLLVLDRCRKREYDRRATRGPNQPSLVSTYYAATIFECAETSRRVREIVLRSYDNAVLPQPFEDTDRGR